MEVVCWEMGERTEGELEMGDGIRGTLRSVDRKGKGVKGEIFSLGFVSDLVFSMYGCFFLRAFL